MSGKEPATKKVFTLPQELAFADTLAAGLIDRNKDDPLALADVLVLLPNRRACRSLKEAFLRIGGQAPRLLPRMVPLGDLDEEELLLSDPLGFPGQAESELPQAIGATERWFLLSRLVVSWRAKVDPDESAGLAQTLKLARELSLLLDEVETEGLSFDKLGSLVPADFSEHWQKTLTFLEIITSAWPALEEERGLVSPAKRRRLLLEWQADLWRRQPPEFPIVAAGSTGSIPASAKLMGVIAGLPRGEIILPGLDLDIDADAWEAIEEDPSHPQYGMARLLRGMGVERKQVALWEGASPPPVLTQRRAALAESLCPARLTDRWVDKGLRFPAAELAPAFEKVSRIDCPGPQEEALTIALAMRETLETDRKTAALVTPDRNLAQRVAAELKRWNITVDDSAGLPLGDTAAGGFLRLTARLLAEGPTAVHLLAALKHPKVRGGNPEGDFRLLLRDFERLVLRGPAPAPELATLRGLLEEAIRDARERERPALERLLPWWRDVEALLKPALAGFSGAKKPLGELLEAHIRLAEALAEDGETPGAELLWQAEDGDAAAKLLRDLLDSAGKAPDLEAKDYAEVFDILISGQMVRKPYAQHPRLFIWGTVEARLQRADRMILGGLNEGGWPAEPDPGPWMSRPMRAALGLPPPERDIGLSAHDFLQALGAEEVILTRADRVEGAPSVPARWLLRLETFLTAVGAAEVLSGGGQQPWLAWAHALDRPEGEPRPWPAPLPRPPLAARPNQASVTDVERWQRDPYAFYAKQVLKLRALDPLEADVTAAERGIQIHSVMEKFCKAFPGVISKESEEFLRNLLGTLESELERRPSQSALWGPRLARIGEWVIEQERARRAGILQVHAECRGRMEVPDSGGFQLHGRADRLEALVGGGWRVLDYKTGAIPTAAEVHEGYSPQLMLEAAMLEAGAFEGLPAGETQELVYWRLTGASDPGEERTIPIEPGEPAEALAALAKLVARYRDPAMPFRARPRPALSLRYNDYAHLARIKEWAGDDEEEWRP